MEQNLIDIYDLVEHAIDNAFWIVTGKVEPTPNFE